MTVETTENGATFARGALMDAELLRKSFRQILERNHDLVARFYDKLLTGHPELRPLFHDRESQEKMLARALVAIVDRIDDAPWLEAQLLILGRRHVHYRVTLPMFDVFREALLATLAESAGKDWTPEVAASWAEGFAEIERVMKLGMLASDTPVPVNTLSGWSTPGAKASS
jgi:hemoglobin-like flavoprotein